MKNSGINAIGGNMASTLPRELLNKYINDFIYAAENCDVNALNNLLELTKSDPISQKKMIHAHEDRAFWHTASNGHIEAMRFLVEITQNDPEALKRMIHAGNDDVFWHTAVNGHIEAMELLIELTQNNPEELKQMIHSGDDGAFHEAIANDNFEIIKFLVILDPFYPWEQICDKEILQKIRPYIGIDIKKLANFSMVSKDPLNESLEIKNAEETNIQREIITDLPKEIIMQISEFLSGGTTQQIDAGIQAFKWDREGNKELGFNNFTESYEQKLMVFENEQNDNMDLMGQESTDI